MKKNLRKILILAIISIFAISIVGCNDGKNGADVDKKEDSEVIKDSGKIVVGITYFEPMDFQDEDENWIGFDAELAQMFGEKLGVDVEFQEINWSTKEVELQAGTIDAIWNGLTWSKDRAEQMGMTDAYLTNEQKLVVRKENADMYKTIEDLEGRDIAVESGSAGQEYLNTKLAGVANPIEKEIQLDALTECVASTVDGCIVDGIMASYLINKEGSNFSGLEIISGILDTEIETYSVAFRKGSDLVGMANEFFKEIDEDGRLEELAEKYGIEEALQ